MTKQKRLLLARQSLQEQRADLAIPHLQKLTELDVNDVDAWKLLGFAYHEEQLEPEAVEALQKAVALQPGDTSSALALAQSCFVSGLSAIEPFHNLMKLSPGNLNALRGYASALAAENQYQAATDLLSKALENKPDWLEGHTLLTRLRYTAGDKQHYADSYQQACATQPGNLALRLEWFRAVAQTRDWKVATRILDEGEIKFGSEPQWLLARLFIASESGDDTHAARLFAQTAAFDDVVRDMALVRYSLRYGDIDTAEATARRRIGKPSAAVFWPYLSLIWRLRDIPQAAGWLDGSPPFVSAIDLCHDKSELDQLATLLRQLHTARSPFAEQSVRGGTQTDQNLFLRHEPVLRNLKLRIQQAVAEYVEHLPEPVAGHPLLGIDRKDALRGRIQFSGSWSVRLQSQGYNVCHTHPMGWISSALYISLPSTQDMGSPPAGWIQFGTPPPELKLSLEPYMKVEPDAGRLVLFPSTMWHSTVPFNDGERLVIAFDIRAPRTPGKAAKK